MPGGLARKDDDECVDWGESSLETRDFTRSRSRSRSISPPAWAQRAYQRRHDSARLKYSQQVIGAALRESEAKKKRSNAAEHCLLNATGKCSAHELHLCEASIN